MRINLLFTSILIIFIGYFSYDCQSLEAKMQKKIMTKQEAIIIALNDIEKSLGKLPDTFLLMVTQKDKQITIELTEFPINKSNEKGQSVGGGLRDTVDLEKGIIIERVATQ